MADNPPTIPSTPTPKRFPETSRTLTRQFEPSGRVKAFPKTHSTHNPEFGERGGKCCGAGKEITRRQRTHRSGKRGKGNCGRNNGKWIWQGDKLTEMSFGQSRKRMGKVTLGVMDRRRKMMCESQINDHVSMEHILVLPKETARSPPSPWWRLGHL
mmetsp:Transcript_10681/g.20419  ORF Transcript_10681/g.20419 Transcript_10681/m.20419 type:complete len:156 (+) Transcript_10681:505-972(+)